MITQIVVEQGDILIDGEYGNIVVINGGWDSHLTPKTFNVAEYRNHYGVANLPQTVDIRDIGYWYGDKCYLPPSDSFRSRKAKEQNQEESHV
jgi:hypothetical protein